MEILLSKTQRQREEEKALSKNHGANIKYRKRLVEDQEALTEQKTALQVEREEKELEKFYVETYIKRPV